MEKKNHPSLSLSLIGFRPSARRGGKMSKLASERVSEFHPFVQIMKYRVASPENDNDNKNAKKRPSSLRLTRHSILMIVASRLLSLHLTA